MTAVLMESVEQELLTLKGVVRRYLKVIRSKELPFEERSALKGALVEMLEDLSRE
jgi:hypothetical protein